MALAINGYSVLKAIGKNAKSFPDIVAEVNKQANALVAKQLKKSGLGNLLAIYSAIGGEDFGKLVDQLKGIHYPLLKRLDKHNPDLKGDDRPTSTRVAKGARARRRATQRKPAKAKSPKKKGKKDKEGIMDLNSAKPRER